MPEVQLADGLFIRRHHEVADEEAHGALALGAQNLCRHFFDADILPAVCNGDNLSDDTQALFHSLGRGQVKVRVAAIQQEAHVVSVACGTVG